MSKQVLPTGQLARLLKSQLGNIEKRFWKELNVFKPHKLILDLISKGISPVAEASGRFQRYSQNYIDVIKGKATFLGTKGGGSIRIEALTNDELNSYRASKEARKDNKATKEFIKKNNAIYKGKKVSPVNLKVTGDMHKSLSYNPNTGIILADSELWVFHNEGMGNLPVRRLLPNKEGERFNRRIEQKITEALGNALGLKGNKAKKFITIRFNIK